MWSYSNNKWGSSKPKQIKNKNFCYNIPKWKNNLAYCCNEKAPCPHQPGWRVQTQFGETSRNRISGPSSPDCWQAKTSVLSPPTPMDVFCSKQGRKGKSRGIWDDVITVNERWHWCFGGRGTKEGRIPGWKALLLSHLNREYGSTEYLQCGLLDHITQSDTGLPTFQRKTLLCNFLPWRWR